VILGERRSGNGGAKRHCQRYAYGARHGFLPFGTRRFYVLSRLCVPHLRRMCGAELRLSSEPPHCTSTIVESLPSAEARRRYALRAVPIGFELLPGI
jgi:hypothetical protein